MRSISKPLIIEYLEDLKNKSEIVIRRSDIIQETNDFLISPERMEKFDAACMLIQVIGEIAKKIDSWTSSQMLSQYPEVYWRGVFGCRNIISHDYGNVDPEQIFRIVKIHLPVLIECVNHILKDVENGKWDGFFEKNVNFIRHSKKCVK
jgi:uncharacterized protein with HEPN domain